MKRGRNREKKQKEGKRGRVTMARGRRCAVVLTCTTYCLTYAIRCVLCARRLPTHLLLVIIQSTEIARGDAVVALAVDEQLLDPL